MTKMPPDLQCIRDCEGEYDKTKHMSQDEAYFNGFDACYEAMSKTHVPIADVQVLLEALKSIGNDSITINLLAINIAPIQVCNKTVGQIAREALEAFNRARQARAGGGE